MYIVSSRILLQLLKYDYFTDTRETTDEQQEQHSSSASKLSTKSGLAALSADTVDELLIETVEQKRPLWDHSQGYKNRSKLKIDALWTEVSNMIGGMYTK